MDKWNFVVCRTNEGAMVDRTLYSNWEKSIPTITNKPFLSCMWTCRMHGVGVSPVCPG